MSEFDSPWKEALDLYFELFLLFFFPFAHAEIDWSHDYEALDKELQQIVPEGELGERVVHKLVKVWLKDGSERWVLVHIEVQSQEEGRFPRRMFVYHYRLFDRYDREVVSLAILGDDRPNWRPNHFGYGRWGCRMDFAFPIVKLLDYQAQEASLESDPNPFATVVLAHLKAIETRQDPVNRHDWKLRIARGLLDRGLKAEDVRQLLRFLDWMMDLPLGMEEQFREEVRQYEEEKQMPFITSFERYGIRQGLLEGIELGLELKFGEEGLKLLPEISQLTDLDLLRAVVKSIKTAKTPDDIRRAWSPGS
jgi:hypothetical protein